MQDYEKFRQSMLLLGEIFDKEITESLFNVYWQVLKPFPDDKCKQAFEGIINESRYFPKPAEFIEKLKGKKEDQATLAWLQVLDSVKRVGNYQSVQFSDIAIHSVIEAMGGWPQLCMMEVKDEKWKQKEFERLYYVITQREGKHPPYLPGTHELSNKSQGFDVAVELVKIGFERHVKEITA